MDSASTAERFQVLLIDDQRIVYESIRQLLKDQSDLEICYCGEPSAALAEAARIEPTVILLDLVMPGVDGLTLLRFLRRHPKTRDVPVVVLSSKEEAEKKAQAFAGGANDYLVKLPDKVELVARIRYHCQAYRTQKERDQAHLDLRASQKELEKRHLQLKALNEQLADASRAKGDFLARMSHEIRTPLNGVIGIAEVLLGSELNEQQRRNVSVIRTSGDMLLGLLNEVLDLSKVEAGRIELEEAVFDPAELVDQVVQLLGNATRTTGIALRYMVEPALWNPCVGDPARLRQCLTNLVGNAIKFTSEGAVLVRAQVLEDTGDPLVRFEVEDTGIGISPVACTTIFDPFTQAEASTTREYGGTGLGLAITQQLAELMGGEVGVDSRLGEGSTFWFTARLKRQEAAEKAELFPHLRVLVADPNPYCRTILGDQFRSWGAAVEETATLEGLPAGYDFWLVDAGLARERGLCESEQCLLTGCFNGTLSDRANCLPEPLSLPQLRHKLLGKERATPDEAPAEETPTPRTEPPKVLVADDNAINRTVAEEMLKTLGCHVGTVADGAEAVEAVLGSGYDLVLMDCEMPTVDGYEASRRIRAQGFPSVPIVALTGHAGKEARQRCLEAGMNESLSKPLTLEKLSEVLKTWAHHGMETTS